MFVGFVIDEETRGILNYLRWSHEILIELRLLFKHFTWNFIDLKFCADFEENYYLFSSLYHLCPQTTFRKKTNLNLSQYLNGSFEQSSQARLGLSASKWPDADHPLDLQHQAKFSAVKIVTQHPNVNESSLNVWAVFARKFLQARMQPTRKFT